MRIQKKMKKCRDTVRISSTINCVTGAKYPLFRRRLNFFSCASPQSL